MTEKLYLTTITWDPEYGELECNKPIDRRNKFCDYQVVEFDVEEKPKSFYTNYFYGGSYKLVNKSDINKLKVENINAARIRVKFYIYSEEPISVDEMYTLVKNYIVSNI